MGQELNQVSRREPGWVSRDDRMPTFIEGRAVRADGSVLDVTMSDMSREGCRLDYDSATLDIGEWIDLESEGQCAMRGQVRWSLMGSAGVRFAKA